VIPFDSFNLPFQINSVSQKSDRLLRQSTTTSRSLYTQFATPECSLYTGIIIHLLLLHDIVRTVARRI